MISVIVPLSRRRKQWFDRYCLPSIRAAMTSEDELIIVSRDGSAPSKRNEGARKARGEFLFFCDDDTLLAADCLRTLRAAIDGHDVAYCDFDGAVWPGCNRKPFHHTAKPWNVEALHEMNFISTMSLVRKSAFPGFDESLTRYQDWDLWLTMAGAGASGVYVAESLFTACYLDSGISDQGNAETLRQVIRDKHRRETVDQKRRRITKDVAESMPPMRLLDIGCGGCVVADIFAAAGHDVRVCDVTNARVPDHWRSRFSQTGALEADLSDCDGVILAGLLYHLTEQSQDTLIAKLRTANLPAIIDTHYTTQHSRGELRHPTASSEATPLIPSLAWVQAIAPRKWPDHVAGRSWFTW